MNNYDFLNILVLNVGMYLLILSIVSFIYFLLFRKIIKNPIDPLLLIQVSAIFGIADVALMYFAGAIKLYYFSSFLLTQAAFILGFFTLRKFEFKYITTGINTRKMPFLEVGMESVVSSVFLFILIQSFVYLQKGIPLFYESRLDYYTGGSGFGFFSRILDVLATFVCFILVDKIISLPRKTYGVILFLGLAMCFYIATLILSGSKGSILTVLSILFYFYYMNRRLDYIQKIWRKYKWLIIGGGLSLVLLMVTVQMRTAANEEGSAIILLLYRFIASGDIYWYTYPDDVIFTYVPVQNGFIMMLNDFLGLFRIIDWNSFQEYPGMYYYKYHHPSELTQGANMRHNVFGLLYFGFWGSIIYSFLLGMVLSCIRFFLPFLSINNTYFRFACIYLLIKSSAVEGDMTLFSTYINNLFVVLPLIFIFNFFIGSFVKMSWPNGIVDRNPLLQG